MGDLDVKKKLTIGCCGSELCKGDLTDPPIVMTSPTNRPLLGLARNLSITIRSVFVEPRFFEQEPF